MGNLRDLYGCPNVEGLKERVAAACWREAKKIFNEDDSVENHAARVRWGIRVLRALDSEDLVFAEMLKDVVTVHDSGDVTDKQIEDTVGITANHFASAGVS